MVTKSTILKTTLQLDLMNELRHFINEANNQTKCTPLELTKTSLYILKSLPAARNAVLEYLRNVFDTTVSNYVTRIETEISTGNLPPANEYDEVILNEIHTVLCGFVSTNTEAWAPIISAWSLELLGEISSKYAGRAHMSGGLNETLQLWMNCRGTRALIDITTQCLTCLMHSDTEACINALLDTSVKHSPNFDWVVAHVGSCFPQTVIVRVLSCGLKDFCQNKSYQQGCKSPKLKSVVGILGHLATSHTTDIQKALLDMFNWCLTDTSFQEPESVRVQKKAAVPFLLQLLTLSTTLLNSICDDIRETIDVDIVLKFYNMIDDWCKYFGSSDALQGLVENLIYQCEKGGSQIVSLLLDCIFLKANGNNLESTVFTISHHAREIFECVLQKIDYAIRYQNLPNRSPIHILNSLIYDIDDICKMLLSEETIRLQAAARIIVYIGENHPTVLIDSVSYVLLNANRDEHLAYVVRIMNDELIDKTISPYVEKGGHFAVVLGRILNKNYFDLNNLSALSDSLKGKNVTKRAISMKSQSNGYSNRFWKNLLTLLEWEKSNKIFLLQSRCISKGIEVNLTELTAIFRNKNFDIDSYHTLCHILDLTELPMSNTTVTYNMPLQVQLNFVIGSVNYFFLCCKETNEILRMNGFKRVRNLFRKLSTQSKMSRNLALRLLLEKSLFSKDAALFGAIPNDDSKQSEPQSLISQNKKISKTIHLTKHSSVFNGGIIGNGRRISMCAHTPQIDWVYTNTHQLISIIKACCALPSEMQNGKTLDLLHDSTTLVSLSLVQLVSPDVMYNGLPWPEEDFSKVTIERDLHIRRLFNNIPLLWDLLDFVALYRPALCFCSILIRALTATLIHQWTSMGEQSKTAASDSYKSLMKTTVKVLDVMTLGQLLPPPLCSIRDVVPFLTSYEIVSILRDCIWCYMRDNIPSPALFNLDTNGVNWRDPNIVRPSEVYTKTLRTIMQRNIKTVGHLYAQLFIMIPKVD